MERDDATRYGDLEQRWGDISRAGRQQMRRQGTKQKKTGEFPAGEGRARQEETSGSRVGKKAAVYDSPLPQWNVPDVQLSGVMNLSAPTVSSVICRWWERQQPPLKLSPVSFSFCVFIIFTSSPFFCPAALWWCFFPTFPPPLLSCSVYKMEMAPCGLPFLKSLPLSSNLALNPLCFVLVNYINTLFSLLSIDCDGLII